MNDSYQAIVVLGGGINKQGAIPAAVTKRIDKALELSGSAVPIIMSGKWSMLIEYTPPKTEAQAMREYALEKLPQADQGLMLVEGESMDTIGNAYFSRLTFLEPNDWHNILLITSEFHMPRAQYIFKKVLGPAYSLFCETTSSEKTPEELERTAEVQDRILAFTKQHLGPIRNGDMNAVCKVLKLMPGYNPEPQFTRKELLKILHTGK